jgi:hypothetical protein
VLAASLKVLTPSLKVLTPSLKVLTPSLKVLVASLKVLVASPKVLALAADPTRAQKVHTTHDKNRGKPEDRDNYRKDAAKESQEWTDVPGMGELPEQFDQNEYACGDGRSDQGGKQRRLAC